MILMGHTNFSRIGHILIFLMQSSIDPPVKDIAERRRRKRGTRRRMDSLAMVTPGRN